MQEANEIAEIATKYVNTTHQHIFLTGKAGTGKTTFLKQIIGNTYKNTIVAAPTGIAAINAGGVTLHSLFQLPFGTFIPENIPLQESHNQVNTPQTLFSNRQMNGTKRRMLQELELLIIDEVSMLRADVLDCMDFVLRHVRRNQAPFGGLQILFIGDLLQLPPVVKENEKSLLAPYYSSVYFFESLALKKQTPIHVELKKIYRQQDQDFIDLLNRLRHNEQQEDDLNFLNKFYKSQSQIEELKGYVHLTTHNTKADRINLNRLNNLDEKTHNYNAKVEGEFPQNMLPTENNLQLKKGAQIMFIKNDPSGEGLFFNGKLATISDLSSDEIKVKFGHGLRWKLDTLELIGFVEPFDVEY